MAHESRAHARHRQSSIRHEVHRQTQCLLRSSPAYRSLDARRRSQVERGTEALVAALSASELAEGVRTVDFPVFVAGLIQGVFQAVVNASIKQMEAYADLVKEVAKSLEAFACDNVSSASVESISAALREAIGRGGTDAASRQQVLATMVSMGINRIVVSDGKIEARVCFGVSCRRQGCTRCLATRRRFGASRLPAAVLHRWRRRGAQAPTRGC